jgi:hypothetical protein
MTPTLRETREIVREEPLMQRPILEALAAGPLTVPEIAEKIGFPSREVLFWVMGMRRFGHVVELPEPDDDGYFRYEAFDKGVPS